MHTIHATSIHRYDVVIVGGGIAGIAIAEFLSRKHSLSIKVIDQAPHLGTGASGKLEGWLHTGALYSGHDDGQTFMNCINALEDLITHYTSYFPGRCNFSCAEKQPDLFVPTAVACDGGWFNDAPVFYMYPTQHAPEIRLSQLKNDAVLLEMQRQRVLGRLEAAFGQQHNWLQSGQCQAPTYAQIEGYRGSLCSLTHTSGLLRDVCQRFDRSFGFPDSPYDIIQSPDVALSPATIMRDLVASALANGVEFETGLSIENLVLDRVAPMRINSLLCRGQSHFQQHIKATLFVFAVGAGFERYLKALHLSARLKLSNSAMVVAWPAVSRVNFARMSIKSRFHFNHLVHCAKGERGPIQFSMLANSGFSEQDADVGERVADLDTLLDAAERHFGREELYARELYAYECIKTEFLSDDKEKRRYSYWVEHPPDSNYICVLPGKFSFFPTVAYQTYLRIKELLHLNEASPRTRYAAEHEHERLAQTLVAVPYPVQILTPALNQHADSLTRACDGLSWTSPH